MAVRFSNIIGLNVVGKTESIGSVHDLLFDDRSWRLRYVVVQTGNWFMDRRIVLAPGSFSAKALDFNVALTADLTHAQIEAAPLYEDHLPVSRQYESKVHEHYGWLPYWLSRQQTLFQYPDAAIAGATQTPEMARLQWQALAERRTADYDGNLRSLNEVSSYKIASDDDKEFGEVVDALIDDQDWQIIDLVLNSHRWLPGGKEFVVSPYFVRKLDDDNSLIEIAQTKQTLLEGPEFDPATYGEAYRKSLVDHYLDRVR